MTIWLWFVELTEMELFDDDDDMVLDEELLDDDGIEWGTNIWWRTASLSISISGLLVLC